MILEIIQRFMKIFSEKWHSHLFNSPNLRISDILTPLFQQIKISPEQNLVRYPPNYSIDYDLFGILFIRTIRMVEFKNDCDFLTKSNYWNEDHAFNPSYTKFGHIIWNYISSKICIDQDEYEIMENIDFDLTVSEKDIPLL